jgi:hypothetical protein
MVGRLSTMKRNYSNVIGENSRKQGLENKRREVITFSLTMSVLANSNHYSTYIYIYVYVYIYIYMNPGKKGSSPIIRN